jgi:hypothetical protein
MKALALAFVLAAALPAHAVEVIEGVATVAADDPCPAPVCRHYSSNGYADWYEYLPLSFVPETLPLDPPSIPSPIPEPSAWVLMALGILGVVGWKARA